MMSNLAGAWLERAGARVPRDKDGNVTVPLEISPRLALDAEELAVKWSAKRAIDAPTYLE
jgi:hypothetical protein